MSDTGDGAGSEAQNKPLYLGSHIGPQTRKAAGFNVNYPILFGAAGVFVLGLVGAVTLMSMQRGTPSLSEARQCLEARDIDCAEDDYKAYVRKYPNDSSANAVLAITLTQDGHHQEALPYYKRALALGVATYDLYANYAVSLNITGDVNQAIKMNYEALKLVPNLMDVRTSLADELVRQGRAKEAVSMLEAFDQTLVEQGQSPYFDSKVEEIKTAHGIVDPAPALAAVTGPGTQEVPLQGEHGALFVPVLVDGALTLNFVVDSGASQVTIPFDVARTLERLGKLSRADYVGSGMFTMANGASVPAQIVMIRSMKVGGQEVRNVTAAVGNTNGALLLGQSFLRHFRSWSVDNNRKVLVLQGAADPAALAAK